MCKGRQGVIGAGRAGCATGLGDVSGGDTTNKTESAYNAGKYEINPGFHLFCFYIDNNTRRG